jgi:hypothetical protein
MIPIFNLIKIFILFSFTESFKLKKNCQHKNGHRQQKDHEETKNQ